MEPGDCSHASLEADLDTPRLVNAPGLNRAVKQYLRAHDRQTKRLVRSGLLPSLMAGHLPVLNASLQDWATQQQTIGFTMSASS